MKKITLLFLAGLSLISCQKATQKVVEEPAPAKMIAFKQSGLVSPFGATVDTKATEVTESTLNSGGFNVSCTTGSAGSESSTWNNVAFSKDGDYFLATSADKWWPNADPSYHFYASNSALTFVADGTTVAATNATDVVCAYLASPTYNSTNTLTFEHIFARITDVTFSGGDDYTITGISVTITPKTGGTYNLRTGAGQTDGTGWSSLTTGSATGIANATPGTKSNDLYLVPGTYTLTASWTATKGPYTKTFTDKTVDIAVVGGKRNSITANLTGDATDISFGVNVQAWDNNTVAIGTYPLPGPTTLNYVQLGPIIDGFGEVISVGSGYDVSDTNNPPTIYNQDWEDMLSSYNVTSFNAGNDAILYTIASQDHRTLYIYLTNGVPTNYHWIHGGGSLNSLRI